MLSGSLKIESLTCEVAGSAPVLSERDHLRRGLWYAVILALPVWIAFGWLVLRQG